MTADGHCRTYWGSHGCSFERGHAGRHECDCCECYDHARQHEDEGCVAKPPYYGRETVFSGEDAEETRQFAPACVVRRIAERIAERRAGLLARLND